MAMEINMFTTPQHDSYQEAVTNLRNLKFKEDPRRQLFKKQKQPKKRQLRLRNPGNPVNPGNRIYIGTRMGEFKES